MESGNLGRVWSVRCCLILALGMILCGSGSDGFAQSTLEYMTLQGQVQGSMQKAAGPIQTPAEQPAAAPSFGEEPEKETVSEGLRNFTGMFGVKQIVVLLALALLLWQLMHKKS